MASKGIFSKRCLAALAAGAVMAFSGGSALAGEGGHWTYEGEHGPAHWGHITKEYAACSEGKNQSPVNIAGASEAALNDIEINYKASKLDVVNNGHTVQANYDAGSSIKVNGTEYQLLQFHFHGPSEHTVNGKSYPLENHFVHKSAKGELAVIGVLIEEGAENAAFKGIWANLPKKSGEKKTADVSYGATDLMPKAKTYSTYPGSLTTPPCSEGVTWLVLNEPIQMSKAQIEEIKAIIKDNNRPVQPINTRKISTKAPAKK